MVKQLVDPRRGTLEARHAWIAARREAWRDRDESRYRLAADLAERARLSIPHDEGYLVVPPGTLAEAAEVAASANALIDEIGHERLLDDYRKKQQPMARGFLPAGARGLSSPYMRFALSEDVLAPVTAYLGVVPVLEYVDVWYSPAAKKKEQAARKELRSSQLWHMDGDDATQVKVWIHCSDIGPESGPLTGLGASRSEAFAQHIGYDTSVEYRITDEKMRAFVGDENLVRFEGPKGTVDFVDTTRCFHFGSRVEPGAPARRIYMAKYVTAYAFKFERDHREEAPFRELASARSSELESLVLGAI